MSGDIFDCHNWPRCWANVLRVSGRHRPRTLLKVLHAQDSSHSKKIIGPKMSRTLTWRENVKTEVAYSQFKFEGKWNSKLKVPKMTMIKPWVKLTIVDVVTPIKCEQVQCSYKNNIPWQRRLHFKSTWMTQRKSTW